MPRRRSPFPKPRGQPPVHWTEDMLATLVSMRARHIPLQACAERVGVAYMVANKKARELGIAQRFNRGCIAAVIKEG